MDDTIIKTERLILRYQRRSDIKFLVSLWMDEDMTRFVGGPRDKAFLIEEFRKTGDDPRKEEYDLWVLETKGNHEPIGHAGLVPKEIKDKPYIELNYYIDKTKWKKGYAQEIARSLVAYAFDTKRLDKVVAVIDPENEASKAVARAVGMKYWINEERSGKVKSIYLIKNKEESAPQP